jgi:hypothetical protein
MLMLNNYFARFRLPGNLLKTKKNVLPIFVVTRNFLFIYFLASKTNIFHISFVESKNQLRKEAQLNRFYFYVFF